MSNTPPIKWAQRKDSVYVTVDIPDAKDHTIKLTKESLEFSATSEGREFSVVLNFFKPVDPEHEGSRYEVRPRDVHFHIMKEEVSEDHWPRLIKDKALAKRTVKTDWSRYVDEDEEKEGFDTSALGDGAMNFGGAEGGAPGGMPGGGNFDMSQLQSMLAGAGGGMPDMGSMGDLGPEDDSDDSDDDLPDLAPDEDEGGAL